MRTPSPPVLSAVVLAGLLAGCEAPGETPFDVPSPVALEGPAPPPPDLTTTAFVSGQPALVRASGVPAGADVVLVRGTALGAGICPPPLAGDCLDLLDMAKVGRVRADASGEAVFTLPVPRAAPVGATLALQAAARVGGAWALGDAIEVVVSHPDDACDRSAGGGRTAVEATLECDLQALINDARDQGGSCPGGQSHRPSDPLVMDDRLRLAARVHATWVATNGVVTHDSPGGPLGTTVVERIEAAGYTGWQSWGENIHRGRGTPGGVLQSWMGSRIHCNNLLKPRFEDVGVGYAVAPDGEPYWVAVFARPF